MVDGRFAARRDAGVGDYCSKLVGWRVREFVVETAGRAACFIPSALSLICFQGKVSKTLRRDAVLSVTMDSLRKVAIAARETVGNRRAEVNQSHVEITRLIFALVTSRAAQASAADDSSQSAQYYTAF